jgi:hypothetical protein
LAENPDIGALFARSGVQAHEWMQTHQAEDRATISAAVENGPAKAG